MKDGDYSLNDFYMQFKTRNYPYLCLVEPY